MSDNALINLNLGNWADPAKVLIERVSDAVGGIARPGQIVRVAKAEAKAELIRTESRIQLTEIEQRALARMVRDEGQKQENIENITAKAIPHLSKDSKPEDIEKDWLTHFFDRCRSISDEEMQCVWAKILACESNSPGSFSKKTIELTGSLDKRDAQLFTDLGTFVWLIAGSVPLIFDERDDIYNRQNINFSTLNHLDSLGLITHNSLGFERLKLKKYISVSYFGQQITIEFAQNENNLPIGNVLFTRAGRELLSICGAKSSDSYFQYVIEKWYEEGRILSSPIKNTN